MARGLLLPAAFVCAGRGGDGDEDGDGAQPHRAVSGGGRDPQGGERALCSSLECLGPGSGCSAALNRSEQGAAGSRPPVAEPRRALAPHPSVRAPPPFPSFLSRCSLSTGPRAPWAGRDPADPRRPSAPALCHEGDAGLTAAFAVQAAYRRQRGSGMSQLPAFTLRVPENTESDG